VVFVKLEIKASPVTPARPFHVATLVILREFQRPKSLP
jgi:hypothetical protein